MTNPLCVGATTRSFAAASLPCRPPLFRPAARPPSLPPCLGVSLPPPHTHTPQPPPSRVHSSVYMPPAPGAGEQSPCCRRRLHCTQLCLPRHPAGFPCVQNFCDCRSFVALSTTVPQVGSNWVEEAGRRRRRRPARSSPPEARQAHPRPGSALLVHPAGTGEGSIDQGRVQGRGTPICIWGSTLAAARPRSLLGSPHGVALPLPAELLLTLLIRSSKAPRRVGERRFSA